MSAERVVRRPSKVSGVYTLERVKSFQQVANRHGVTVEVKAGAGERYETQKGYRSTVPKGKAHVILHHKHDLNTFYADADFEFNLKDKSLLHKLYARHIKPRANQ